MVVLAVDRNWQANEKSVPKTAFKVGLLHDDDLTFSRPRKEEIVLFWWMTIEQYSLQLQTSKRILTEAAAEKIAEIQPYESHVSEPHHVSSSSAT